MQINCDMNVFAGRLIVQRHLMGHVWYWHPPRPSAVFKLQPLLRSPLCSTNANGWQWRAFRLAVMRKQESVNSPHYRVLARWFVPLLSAATTQPTVLVYSSKSHYDPGTDINYALHLRSTSPWKKALAS